MSYKVKTGWVGARPRSMFYKHYLPEIKSREGIIVFVGGGGHTMKIWEETPDGQKGWARIFAEKGRELIMVDWVCGSPNFYQCSPEKLCALTQRENMELIRQVLIEEIGDERKVVFFGWSMGGPQVFVLAADFMPQRTSAILGYAATGPLNYYYPTAADSSLPLDLNSLYFIPRATIDIICDSPLFPQEHKEKYIKEYLIPIPPLMVAIQKKRKEVENKWGILTVKNPQNIPSVFLVNGTRDLSGVNKGKLLEKWLKQFQTDVTLAYIADFCHLGMLCRGGEKAVDLYLDWLRERDL